MTTGEWTVDGEIICPVCTLFIDFTGTPDQLLTAITAHRCAQEED